jgi:HD-like signal output (HDOD) protein
METKSSQPLQQPQNRLLRRCCRDVECEELILPTLPEISLKIRRAINDQDASSGKIAKVVQMDPAIAARLIHIANSPLYRGRKKIESCPEALTRLGLKAAQHLITSFALRSVFIARSRYIRKQMQHLWTHSSYVAAISAVLAHKTHGFDPDRAMLAGLVHDIGVVPVLTYADRHPELVTDVSDIEQTVHELRARLGVLIMRQWSFPADFEEVVLNAENWWRDEHAEADYTDVVIVSQLHSFVGTLPMRKYPKLPEVPAFRKFSSGRPDTELSLDLLSLAKDDIWQVQQMLTC